MDRRLTSVLVISIVLVLSSLLLFRGEPLAKRLTEKGWVMYGAHYVTDCNIQQSLLGEDFVYIEYVDCSKHGCPAMVKVYPTWVRYGPNGTVLKIAEGLQSLEELERLARED